MSTDFACDTCFDTRTIDQGGREIPCPDCAPVTIKITGLSHGAGEYGINYSTAIVYTSSTITFCALTRALIFADVANVRSAQVGIARRHGLTSRNSTSSWAIAIEKRVRAAVAS